jgi:hypothetical protein
MSYRVIERVIKGRAYLYLRHQYRVPGRRSPVQKDTYLRPSGGGVVRSGRIADAKVLSHYMRELRKTPEEKAKDAENAVELAEFIQAGYQAQARMAEWRAQHAHLELKEHVEREVHEEDVAIQKQKGENVEVDLTLQAEREERQAMQEVFDLANDHERGWHDAQSQMDAEWCAMGVPVLEDGSQEGK